MVMAAKQVTYKNSTSAVVVIADVGLVRQLLCCQCKPGNSSREEQKRFVWMFSSLDCCFGGVVRSCYYCRQL